MTLRFGHRREACRGSVEALVTGLAPGEVQKEECTTEDGYFVVGYSAKEVVSSEQGIRLKGGKDRR